MMRTRVFAVVLLAFLGVAGAAHAQSFLGTIRGTVSDPQGAGVSDAAVLVVDEATGVPRAVSTDSQGRFEAANLKPGTYRIEVATPNFKEFKQTGITLRAAGSVNLDVKLELGSRTETVTVTAEAINNITTDSGAIARGLDEQQLHDLPRNSRDIQSFLLLNPNVLGGSDDIQFLGGRTYGVSYIQDGQASTNAIFGTVGNSAPGLDAIAEVQVLSNSYSAEYGGLAGVLVTTKRGSNSYRGTAFYDFNSNGLNALTYNQKLGRSDADLAGLRDDPNSDTHQHRFGASVGGPLKTGKTFFYANYEGSNDKAIFGGSRAIVPTAAMRNGDFRGTAITPRDPLTGQPFPGQVIPASRISPQATAIMNFFYPLPNRGTQANGYGIYQQFVPKTRNRNRADLRFDHEASKNDSIFLRGSYQHFDPNAITFEAGNALTNMPTLDRKLNTASAIAGWTRIFSSTLVNEFRVGYNFDKTSRQSTFINAEVARQLGLETPPSMPADRRGFPSIQFTTGANRPTNIVDAGRAVDRTIVQNAVSVADNVSWIMGGHSFKAGALFNRNIARDGFGTGVNFGGRYQFNAAVTGNAFTDFLLGTPRQSIDQVANRGPLDGHSNDFAAYIQDDWKASRDLTVYLGVRYEIVGVWHEKNDQLANFVLQNGQGFWIVPNSQIAALLPPAVIALNRTKTADQFGLGDGLIKTDKNNISPRVGFAYRLGGSDRTVLRGGFGIFHPTVAVQGLRDLMATNEFRYGVTRRGVTLARGFSTGSIILDPQDYGSEGVDPNIKSPDIYQYNLTFERSLPGNVGLRLSYIGSTMRGLLVNRFENQLPASTRPFDPENDADLARLPLFPIVNTFTNLTYNLGSGQLHAGQLELQRAWRNGLALNVAYTLAHSDGNAPDSGNSSLGVVQYNSFDIEMDRGPDPNVVKHRVVANATWDIPLGRNRKHGANMPGWANALFGGWTVSTIFQARSGNNLTPFFTGYYTTSPWNVGLPLDGVGTCFAGCWRPDQISDPNTGGSRDKFFNQAAYALPAPGKYGNAKKGSLRGPGTWVVNFAFYKDLVASQRFRLQLSALLDNAFNHPQFFTDYGGDFSDLSSFLNDGDPNNGTTAVLGAGAIRTVEGFAPGRVFRVGIRATF
ncbi:MAG TPA: carboxypeptidase-like regulatory domain-containing protein [Vicinamibacteria bacterium]